MKTTHQFKNAILAMLTVVTSATSYGASSSSAGMPTVSKNRVCPFGAIGQERNSKHMDLKNKKKTCPFGSIGQERKPTNEDIRQAFLYSDIKLLCAWRYGDCHTLSERAAEAAHTIADPSFSLFKTDISDQHTLAQDFEILHQQKTLSRLGRYPLNQNLFVHQEIKHSTTLVDLAYLAKDYYLSTQTIPVWLAPHFTGVSIQDLINHGKMPKIEFDASRNFILDLRKKHLNSLEGLNNIPGIECIHRLQLQENRLRSIDNRHLTKLVALKHLHVDANPLSKETKDFLIKKYHKK